MISNQTLNKGISFIKNIDQMDIPKMDSKGRLLRPLGSVLEFYSKSSKLRPDDPSKLEKESVKKGLSSIYNKRVGNMYAVPKFVHKD